LSALISLAHHNRDQDALAIGALYEQARSSVVGGVHSALAAGRGLIEKKAKLSHGEWMPWLEANSELLGFKDRTARLLIKAAAKWQSTANLDAAEAVEISRLIWGNTIVRGTTGTGDNEWFTPPEYIEAARLVLGEIDLDPASHPVAQKTLKAGRIFTREDDGLEQEWHGRIWLNPPYARDEIGRFVDKLILEIDRGNTTAAIMLTHNYTDTLWFQEAARAVDLLCFTRGRIKFVDVAGAECNPTQGQAFFYYGDNTERFRDVFSSFGFVR
jgi:ParB family chromosome partitioning protein